MYEKEEPVFHHTNSPSVAELNSPSGIPTLPDTTVYWALSPVWGTHCTVSPTLMVPSAEVGCIRTSRLQTMTSLPDVVEPPMVEVDAVSGAVVVEVGLTEMTELAVDETVSMELVVVETGSTDFAVVEPVVVKLIGVVVGFTIAVVVVAVVVGTVVASAADVCMNPTMSAWKMQ